MGIVKEAAEGSEQVYAGEKEASKYVVERWERKRNLVVYAL